MLAILNRAYGSSPSPWSSPRGERKLRRLLHPITPARRGATLDTGAVLRHSRAPSAPQENAVPDDRPHDPLENETMRGFNVLIGYRLAEWRDDFARLELALEAKHLNRSGVVHGGVLATMLDVALGYTGIFIAEPGRVRRA